MTGFEQPDYTVLESDGFAEVCVMIFEPESVQFDSNLIVTNIQTVKDTATGM